MSRDESGRDRSGKYSNQFRFHILIRKQKRVRESSVGKTKLVMRQRRAPGFLVTAES